MNTYISDNLIYKSKVHQLAIKIDTLDKVVLAYDLQGGEILQESEGILKRLDSFIAQELEESLNIKLQEYGVEITYDAQNELENIW